MAKSNDWMPGPRTEILVMCRNWIAYMMPDRLGGVPEADVTELTTLFGTAEALWQKAEQFLLTYFGVKGQAA
ncbi:hypothetical protein Holit_01573 [Hollandina sp. SP2]